MKTETINKKTFEYVENNNEKYYSLKDIQNNFNIKLNNREKMLKREYRFYTFREGGIVPSLFINKKYLVEYFIRTATPENYELNINIIRMLNDINTTGGN